MKSIDKGRKWLWWFLGVAAALQLYIVQELLAALALFTLAFLAVAAVVGSFYMLHRSWTSAVERLAYSRRPVMLATKQRIYAVQELARRPFRRPGSEAAP